MFHGFTFAIWIAVSRMAADPEPLSWIPGPALTESRCAPTTTTLLSLRPGSSASTLRVGSVSAPVSVLTRITSPDVPASWAPSDWLIPSDGIVARPPSPRVPSSTPGTLL